MDLIPCNNICLTSHYYTIYVGTFLTIDVGTFATLCHARSPSGEQLITSTTRFPQRIRLESACVFAACMVHGTQFQLRGSSIPRHVPPLVFLVGLSLKITVYSLALVLCSSAGLFFFFHFNVPLFL